VASPTGLPAVLGEFVNLVLAGGILHAVQCDAKESMKEASFLLSLASHCTFGITLPLTRRVVGSDQLPLGFVCVVWLPKL